MVASESRDASKPGWLVSWPGSGQEDVGTISDESGVAGKYVERFLNEAAIGAGVRKYRRASDTLVGPAKGSNGHSSE